MLSPKEFGALHDVSADAVLKWIAAGKLPGAEKELLPFSEGEKFIWRIPENLPRPVKMKPPGRPASPPARGRK